MSHFKPHPILCTSYRNKICSCQGKRGRDPELIQNKFGQALQYLYMRFVLVTLWSNLEILLWFCSPAVVVYTVAVAVLFFVLLSNTAPQKNTLDLACMCGDGGQLVSVSVVALMSIIGWKQDTGIRK